MKHELIYIWAIPLFLSCIFLITTGIRIALKDNFGAILFGLVGCVTIIYTLNNYHHYRLNQ